jgi:hypothetical protein
VIMIRKFKIHGDGDMSKETKITPAAPEEIFSLIKKIFEELMPFDRLLGVKVENSCG